MKYYKKIEGERLYLSPISVEDAALYTKWINDPAVSENLGNASMVVSLGAEKKALETMADTGVNFAMVLKENDVLLGNISLNELNQLHRRAVLGIFIGEEEHRGKGYGGEAIQLLLGFAFETLNLHNVTLKVFSDNQPAVECYKKAGFKEFGSQRQAHFRNGRFVDIIHMDILSTEYLK